VDALNELEPDNKCKIVYFKSILNVY